MVLITRVLIDHRIDNLSKIFKWLKYILAVYLYVCRPLPINLLQFLEVFVDYCPKISHYGLKNIEILETFADDIRVFEIVNDEI